MKTIKAQDVKVGDTIKLDTHLSMQVATIRVDKLPDGQLGYRFFSHNGACIWNRHDEELVLAD